MKRIDPLFAVHHYGNRKTRKASAHGRVHAHRRSEGEDAADHAPVARKHPVTGREGALRGIGKLVRDRRHARRRGVALLDELAAHSTQPKY